MFALIVLPAISMLFSAFMCAGGVWFRTERYHAKHSPVPSSSLPYLPIFLASIALQLLPLWAAFYLRHSLETLVNGRDPLPQTLYSSTMIYGGLGHKIFFWTAMAWCLLMIVGNICTLFMSDEGIEKDILTRN